MRKVKLYFFLSKKKAIGLNLVQKK